MEKTDVAKDPAVKKKGEDLEYAYDAVRVANKSVLPLPLHVLMTFALFHISSHYSHKLQ